VSLVGPTREYVDITGQISDDASALLPDDARRWYTRGLTW